VVAAPTSGAGGAAAASGVGNSLRQVGIPEIVQYFPGSCLALVIGNESDNSVSTKQRVEVDEQ
jgi:hypothetical protein